MRSKDLAFCKAKWYVGNGEDINFWLDDCLSSGPLWDNEDFNGWANVCIERFGSRVRDYRLHNRWIDLSEVSKDLKLLMDLVRHIPLSNDQDVIVWRDTVNRLYSVTSSYESL